MADNRKVEQVRGAPPPGGFGPPPDNSRGSYGPPAGGQSQGTAFGAPPPDSPKYPFINAQWLWQKFGATGGGEAKINGIRDARARRMPSGELSQPGWFLDVTFRDGTNATAKVSIGDIRHKRLYAKFGANLMGQVILIRLAHPGDNTKAPWVVE